VKTQGVTLVFFVTLTPSQYLRSTLLTDACCLEESWWQLHQTCTPSNRIDAVQTVCRVTQRGTGQNVLNDFVVKTADITVDWWTGTNLGTKPAVCRHPGSARSCPEGGDSGREVPCQSCSKSCLCVSRPPTHATTPPGGVGRGSELAMDCSRGPECRRLPTP
jgi:hypothetical protein